MNETLQNINCQTRVFIENIKVEPSGAYWFGFRWYTLFMWCRMIRKMSFLYPYGAVYISSKIGSAKVLNLSYAKLYHSCQDRENNIFCVSTEVKDNVKIHVFTRMYEVREKEISSATVCSKATERMVSEAPKFVNSLLWRTEGYTRNGSDRRNQPLLINAAV